MIDSATVEKILDSADIVDVVSDFITLKRRGANHIACCPFHNEKTPSFSVSQSKGIFKCFGCGKSGSSVGFVMEHEQMTYVEALRYLANKYGIEIIEKDETPEEVAKRQNRESLLVVSELAQKYYSRVLQSSKYGRNIGLSYFKDKRGFSEEIIEKFGLGFALDHHHTDEVFSSFCDYALKGGYKKEYLINSGLAIERNDGSVFDKFYDRALFPIHSLSGRVIAFGGRTLREDKQIAKYINSPETEIYNKSRSLYGIYFAKASISRLQKCYLVEGYTDVISFHQAGIENVIASSGTSLTIEQIRLIKRFTNKVCVIYDGDSAGIKASLRGIDMLLEEGLEIKVIPLPDGEDPDSFARAHSTEQIQSFLLNSEIDFIEFKYSILSKDIAKDPIRKAELIHEIIRTVSLIPDPISRSVYIEETSNKLGMKAEILTREVSKVRSENINKKQAQQKAAIPADFFAPDIAPKERVVETRKEQKWQKSATYTSEREILYYLIRFGELNIDSETSVSEYIHSELKCDDIELLDSNFKLVYDEYYKVRDELGKVESQDIIQKRLFHHESKIVREISLDLIYEQHTLSIKEFTRSLVPEENILNTTVPKAILIFKSKFTAHTYQTVMEELRAASEKKDQELEKKLMLKLKVLMLVKNRFAKELNRLN